jgi:Protein of unknown function (DUF3631)
MPHESEIYVHPDTGTVYKIKVRSPRMNGRANGNKIASGDALDSDAAKIIELAHLDPVAYDRSRKDAAKGLGIGVKTLDAEVSKRRRTNTEVHGADFLATVEPWHEAVDGARLLDDLAGVITRHVGLPEGGADAVALWAVHTHALDAAAMTPLLAITSPTPECGKSTLLGLVGKLALSPLPASNITPAAVFRAIEKWRPTLLIDEADTFLRDNNELRGVLDSGHGRDSAFVVRTVGDDHEPRHFSTWAAKAIALIGDLPATLASRSIHVEMRRLASSETVEPLRFDKASHLSPLARMAARWAADNIDALKESDPIMPEGFANRRADNWRALLAIADRVGAQWPERARQAASLLDRPDAGQTTGLMLLADIRSLFDQRGDDRLSSAEIVEYLGSLDGRPWPEFGRSHKPITANQLARLLKPFKVFTSTIRQGTTTAKGYALADFIEAFSRYLPPEPSHRHNP